MGLITVGTEITTVRVPELPSNEDLGSPLSLDDELPVYLKALNRTAKTSLNLIKTLFATDAGALTPTQNGGKILHVVTVGEEGGDTVSIPSIAGMQFALSKDGFPLKVDVEYEMLSGGGFKLLGGDLLVEGQRYVLDVYELSLINPMPSESAEGGFITGNTIVNTNISLATSDLNKALQVRGAASALTLTLPDVAVCPDNAFLIIETLINNTKPTRIQTSLSQNIYLRNTNKAVIWLHPGESVMLYRTEDGWYAYCNDTNYSRAIGRPTFSYEQDLNQLKCEGQLVNRADYPRLWEKVQTLGGALVSDAVWSTATATVAGRTVNNPNRGCFSQGDGSTTFRLPDFRNSTIRGLKNSDTERAYNYPGGFQRNELEAHTHSYNRTIGGGSYGDNSHDQADQTQQTGSTGGSETRMDNIGGFFVVDY